MKINNILTDSVFIETPIEEEKPKENQLNYVEIKAKTNITLKTKVTPITPNIWISETVVCTVGGVLVVSGQKKAGKSQGMLAIITTALNKKPNPEKSIGIIAKYTEKKIVYFDTEMLEADTQSFITKAMKISDIKEEPTNLIMQNLRQLSLIERKFFLEKFLENEKDIDYLLIDGVADFFGSVNEEEKAREFIDMIFSKKEKDTTVIFAIHEGKDGNGATGHLGQIIERKCSGTIAFFKDRKLKVHTIKCKMVRHGEDFEDIKFMFTKEHFFPVLLNADQLASIQEKSEETKSDELRKVITQTFATTMNLSKEDVIQGFLNYDNTIDKSTKIESQKALARRRYKKSEELGFIKENNKIVTIII